MPVGEGEFLSKALDAARMGVWRWDLTTDEARWSPRMEQIFDLEPGSFGGNVQAYLERIHPDDRPGVQEQMQAVLSGAVSELELRHRIVRADGQVRWLDGWGSVERDADGEPSAVLGTAVDSTERVRIQEALQVFGQRTGRTGREFFEALVRGLSEVLGVRFAFAGQLTSAGERIRAVSVWADGELGQPFDYALRGTPCQDVVTRGLCAYPRDVQRRFPEDTMLVEMGVESYLGIPLHATSGEVLGILVVLDGQPLLDLELASRILQSFAGRAQAELERMRAEDERLENEGRLRQAQHLAKMGIWEWDVTHDRTTWSDEMLEIYGVTRESFTGVGTDYIEFTHPDDRERQRANIQACFARAASQARDAGQPVEVTLDPQELRILRPDGTLRHTRGDAVAVVDAEGRPVRMLGVTLDVTEQKQMEERLLQVQKLETVGRLAGGIAHDFNNLLTVTLASAELALGRLSLDDPTRALLEQIRTTAQRGGELTSQLLSFARKQVLQLEVIDLDARLRQASDGLLKRLIGEHIELELDLRAGLRVQADVGQLEQVLLNLVVNARDAMPDGGRLSIATEARGEHVLWTVRDTGCGIPPETQARAFEPFFTTKGPGEGTGLGLSTCFGIVSQHGGRIELESAPGAGTSVRVWLPASELPRAKVSTEPRAPKAKAGEVVLLVEDEGSVRRLAEQMLQLLGYQVLTAPDGISALDVAAEASRIDLVLSDVVMPRLGGADLAEQLRDRRPDVRVLLMTGYTDEDLRLDDGVRLLRKPYTVSQLAEQVRAALDGGR